MMSSKSTPVLASARSTSSTRSRMSEARRARLRDIQRRALLQDSLNDGLMRSYGRNFPDASHAKRVIAEEVGKVVNSSVITHIDIENMEQKVARRSKLTGRGNRRRASGARASARRKAGARVVGTAKFTPRVLSTSTRTPLDRTPIPPSARARHSKHAAKHKVPKLDASGLPAAQYPQTNGASAAATTTSAADVAAQELARKVEKEKWKHTSSTQIGSFVGSDALHILPSKPKRVGQDDRATVEWNLLTNYKLELSERKDREEAVVKKQERMRNQAFLMKQAEEKRQALAKERAEQIAWDRKMMAESKRQEEAEKAALEAKRVKELAERKEYEKALDVAVQQKKEAAKLEFMSDKAYAQGAALAVKREKEEEERKRQAAKDKFKSFIRDNEAEMAKKQKAKEKEAAEDYQRMLAYMELMDRQQKAREAYFAEFKEKTKRKFEMSLDTHSQAQALEEWTNKRAEEGRRKAEEERLRKENAAAAKRAADKAETLAVLAKQIEEKKQLREAARKRATEERQATTRKVKEAQRLEEEEKRKARIKNLQYRRELERQIRSRSQQLPDPYFHMNDTERMYNYPQLVKAKEHETSRSRASVAKPHVEPFSARRSHR